MDTLELCRNYSETCFCDNLCLSNNMYYVTFILLFLHNTFHIKINLYLATTCLMWAYFSVPLEGHIRLVWLYIFVVNEKKIVYVI
jgi:hypothetical protein